MKKILVVDDELAIRDLIEMILTRAGYEVITAPDGTSALQLVQQTKPDLVVLDLMLPDLDGHEVCKQISFKQSLPIIMLTAKNDVVDKVLGLELGADDYMTKPFDSRELLARVKALLRRSAQVAEAGDCINFQKIHINLANKSLLKEGKQINLTPREFQLLEVLATHPGRVFEREELMSKAWGYEFMGDSRSVDICITRLRKKIEDEASQPQYIVTVYGFGYRFGGA